MSTAESSGNTLDFIHHSGSNSVKINRRGSIKDVEDFNDIITEFLSDFALLWDEFRGRFVFGGEIGGGLTESDRGLKAIKNLAIFVCK